MDYHFIAFIITITNQVKEQSNTAELKTNSNTLSVITFAINTNPPSKLSSNLSARGRNEFLSTFSVLITSLSVCG